MNSIKKMRMKLGLSQDQLASLVGVSTGLISLWENEKQAVNVKMKDRLARIFQVKTEDLK